MDVADPAEQVLDLAALQLADEIPVLEQIDADGRLLRLELLGAILPHRRDPACGQRGQQFDRYVLDRGEDLDAARIPARLDDVGVDTVQVRRDDSGVERGEQINHHWTVSAHAVPSDQRAPSAIRFPPGGRWRRHRDGG